MVNTSLEDGTVWAPLKKTVVSINHDVLLGCLSVVLVLPGGQVLEGITEG